MAARGFLFPIAESVFFEQASGHNRGEESAYSRDQSLQAFAAAPV